MIEQEQLLEFTETYLKSAISQVASSLTENFDSSTSFGELGIDSFYVLKIIKTLEVDFGSLPKTLLFEHFNIADLASYFVSEHQQTIVNKMRENDDGLTLQSPDNRSSIKSAKVSVGGSDSRKIDAAIIMLEKDAQQDPEVAPLINKLFAKYKNETSVSRGTRNIAPFLFIGEDKKGYFNFSRSGKIILVYAYTGLADYLETLTQEFLSYCRDNNFDFNMFSNEQLKSVGDIAFSATPFGVVQRILNLSSFTLKGGAMRRLRYQVSKFEKNGNCHTEEYSSGTDSSTDKDIVRIIEQWCDARTMVNPLIHIVKNEILAGELSSEHRLFLTYIDGKLQNVILISSMAGEQNGYLMDLEFYPKDMPLGGLEYAIANIIEQLVLEGCEMLSLGGTYGCKLNASSNADPALDRVLDELREQNIFNDSGNLQFKNKFRTENETIYLCREITKQNADNVIDIIMMIADPSKSERLNTDFPTTKVSNVLPHQQDTDNSTFDSKYKFESGKVVIEGEQRSVLLADSGFNPFLINNKQIDFDFKTDSWAQLEMPTIKNQMSNLKSKLQQPVDLQSSLRELFPHSYFVVARSGRDAEKAFYKGWEKKGKVYQNLLFPTAIAHQIDNGFSPEEIPVQGVFDLDSSELFKGNIDLEQLKDNLRQDHISTSLVCIEVSDNAAGGYPVSIQHLKEIKDLLKEYAIPLVIDATRVIENAMFIIKNEQGYRDQNVWQVVKEILTFADVVIASFAKDFGINKGGFIATNDQQLFRELENIVSQEGIGVDIIDRKLLAIALKNKRQIEMFCSRRLDNVQLIWHALYSNNVPVVCPEGSHCILIDVKQMPEFSGFEFPVASFIAWLYLSTGIRAGAHSVGMQRNSKLSNLVRIAIPVGLSKTQATEVIQRLIAAFKNLTNIPELLKLDEATSSYGELTERYQLSQYHNLTKPVISRNSLPGSGVANTVNDKSVSESNFPNFVTSPQSLGSELTIKSASQMDNAQSNKPIAIVGMAGRYPKAKNLDEMWKNLVQGVDCIRTISSNRFGKRNQLENAAKYQGGFIDDIDKFDSLFFNISPREAETLDPQERLFLEVAWETLEDAGYYPEVFQQNNKQDVGVFVGAVWTMYQILGAEERQQGKEVVANSFLWSIANRVSYFMNFSGPSMTVDTACSASLTAIYLANEAIQKGECNSAIVGGVNIDAHQCKQEITVAGGLLSEDARCHTFGKMANGYVPGEGIGAIYLKPLAQAEKDRDNIYAVIKGVNVNHGGRTSGYSVPNSKSQSALVSKVLSDANVDARSIGYIEAHGTGTELGDPIEITGLTNSFKNYQAEKQGCSIGSVKTNIGHLEAAAGIAGVCKVLLQMDHEQLVPSLHSSELNEHIDFENSPFFVQQVSESWQGKAVNGVTYPLRASVSSFGAGGANAHIILEKFSPGSQHLTDPCQSSNNQEVYRIVPLSARNENQLREAAKNLKEYLHSRVELCETNLSELFQNIVFTLQLGRKTFSHRLAIVAKDPLELIEKLSCFIDGKSDENIINGNATNNDGISKLLSQKEKTEFINLLVQSRNPFKLAQLWIDGVLTDWQGNQSNEMGRRISLPTYPFADKRHWLASGTKTVLTTHEQAKMHPMIDSNESTFERQVFKKLFNHNEFFIYDHLVSEIPTLPGVGYLDFARKAGEIAAGRKVQKIQNILWVSPLTVENSKPNEVFIELKPAGETVQFEVFSQHDDKKQLYSQGKLYYSTMQDTEVESEYVDIDSIQSRCVKVMDGKDAYPLFKSLGLDLGPSFQVLQEVYKNDSEVLGRLEIPEIREADFDDYILHPSLVDGSFQAVMGAQLGGGAEGGMVVPYSLGEVEILHPLTKTCYSYVVDAAKDNKADSKLSKKNVLILDENGKVLVKVFDSVGVPLTDVHEKPTQQKDDGFDKLYYSTEWQSSSQLPLLKSDEKLSPMILFDTDEVLYDSYQKILKSVGADTTNIVLVKPGSRFEEINQHSYILSPESKEDFIQLFDALNKNNIPIGRVCFAWSALLSSQEKAQNRQSLEGSLERGVYSFLYLCQTVIDKKLEGDIELVYLHLTQDTNTDATNEAINGFINILRAESPKFRCKSLEIQLPQANMDEDVLELVLSEYQDEQNIAAVRYKDNHRYQRTIKRIEMELEENSIDEKGRNKKQPLHQTAGLKHQGVYLITGGAGGLGFIFAEHLAKKYQANLILTGRSELSEEQQTKISALEALGAKVFYHPADVSDFDSVTKLITESRARFGQINGVIHSAGVLRDSYIRNKTRSEMEAVFASKLYGTLNLDQATKNEQLDFFVMFSSLAALAGNAGQSDYSYANHFMDSFAGTRQRLQQSGQRYGKSLSLNWSLWADGGMQLDEQTELFFRKNLGIKALSIDTGIEAFEKGLSTNRASFAVIEGVQEKIEKAWGLTKDDTPKIEAQATEESQTSKDSKQSDSELTGLVQAELSKIVMEFLKLDAEDVDIDTILLDLGFDSIGLTTFANAVNEIYPLDVTPVLFFEYPNIREIAKYIAEENFEVATAYHPLAGGGKTTNRKLPKDAVSEKSPADSIRISKGWQPESVVDKSELAEIQAGISPENRFVQQPIAIVGAAGVMPQSEDLEEYWSKLRNAENNMVTVVPEDRWSWQEFYGDPLTEENKTKSKWGGFMKEVDKFDPLFWGISPREAEMMDPQQRIFLETVWKAIEDSGQKVSELAGTRTGLFVGASTRDYIDLMAAQGAELDGYSASGTSHAILANRVSFLLGLHGPSAPLDTACSSSLVALHRAIESIHTGSSDMAIVGGIQVMLTPAAFISFDAAGMLASDGKCKTFDNRADGYVRGEGSGAIFIKPLAMAEQDGNHIYALVKATAENHGGQATMLTAPNPNAQADLLVEAYEKAHIDPTSVGYIECHGTGTPLGDPIEIQAMKKAFSRLYKKHNKSPAEVPHIGLTSAKTNIGHLETAAGIAGILKVILSIKHQEIPALLHFEEQNEYISLKGTPFYMVDKTRPWEQIKAEDGTLFPRRAGISSFGFGGANVHVVIEEYQDLKSVSQDSDEETHLIVLSAKYQDRLMAYAREMFEYLENHPVNLADFAHTLRVGRDEMSERLALVVSSLDELKQKLKLYLDEQQNIEHFYHGNVRDGKEQLKSDSEINLLLNEHALSKLAEQWVYGQQIDWSKLKASGQNKRISLPAYPFAKERYWFASSKQRSSSVSASDSALNAASYIHPLVQQNTSTLTQQKFESLLTGEEEFVKCESSAARGTLPWALYLEMSRVAGYQSLKSSVRRIQNIRFKTPVNLINNTQKLEVTLVPKNNQIETKIISEGTFSDDNKDVKTHFTASLDYLSETIAPQPSNINKIIQRCSDRNLSQEKVSSILNGLDIKPDKKSQLIEKICLTKYESLTSLRVDESGLACYQQFEFYPSILDAAFQSVLVNMAELKYSFNSAVSPVYIQEVWHYASLAAARYVYVRLDESSQNSKNLYPTATVKILDEQGHLLLAIEGMLIAPLSQQVLEQKSNESNKQEYLKSFEPIWEPVPVSTQSDNKAKKETKLLLLSHQESQYQWLKACYPNSQLLQLPLGATIEAIQEKLKDYEFEQLVWMAPNVSQNPGEPILDYDVLISEQKQGVLSLFSTIKALLELDYKHKPLKLNVITANTQDVIQSDLIEPAHAGVWGFVGSLAKEHVNWRVRLLDIDCLSKVSAVDCLSLSWDAKGDGLAFRKDQWYRRGLATIDGLPADESQPVYKQGGVYVVIGGAGGLGEVWSQYMIENYQAKIVWVGRRKPDAGIEAKLSRLSQLGESPIYVSADATDYHELSSALQSIKKTYPSINGVVHSAIVLKDQNLMQMDTEQFKASLSAKVDISVNMDRVFGQLNLDFMLFFSSVISFMKTPGQSNYAAGCTFKDSFAKKIEKLRPYPVKIINWGYWGSVGVVADQSHNEMMKHLGIGSIEAQEGMDFLQRALNSAKSQLALMKYFNTRFFENILTMEEQNQSRQISQTSGTSDNLAMTTKESVILIDEQAKLDYVKDVVIDELSAALKIDTALVRNEASFFDYGIDSIVGVNLIRSLNESLEIELVTVNLFEHSSVDQLTDFICSNWRKNIERLLAQNNQEQIGSLDLVDGDSSLTEELISKENIFTNKKIDPRDFRIRENSFSSNQGGAVAIIGMSGRFAGSEDLDSFWDNLKHGRDLISEVTRWKPSECVTAGFKGKNYCSRGGFIDSIDKFDASFFDISEQDALQMDPQQRLFLEEAWKGLENAGYANNELAEVDCGIYVGCGRSGYEELVSQDTPVQYLFGGTESSIPSKTAQFLKLRGPAIAVDTGSSSSLVTIHLACQGLWSGEIEMALAGGVCLQATPKLYQAGNHSEMLSTKGRCYSFDSRADGFVPAEGVAVVILKSLEKAQQDGDYIQGVITATGVNQGSSNRNAVDESLAAQQQLLTSVYERFNIEPESIQMIEAHGSGNPSDDFVEYSALNNCFREQTNKNQFCSIGSVKTNIGHAGTAAGIAGLMKVLLALKNRQLPPSINFEKKSSKIDFESSPFYLNTELQDWKVDDHFIRRASVSAFGLSGTNAHLVVEQAPNNQTLKGLRDQQIVMLSAKTSEQLTQKIQGLLAFLQGTPQVSMNDLCFSLYIGRTHFSHRFACITNDQKQLIKQLQVWLESGASGQIYCSEVLANDKQQQVALKNFGNYCIQQLNDNGVADLENSGEHLQTLADLYTQGYELEYERLFANQSKRIPLPSYPFAKESYWPTEIQKWHKQNNSNLSSKIATKSGSVDEGVLIKKSLTESEDIALETNLVGKTLKSDVNQFDDYHILIPMQTQGKEKPVFAIPGAGGSVMSLQELSRALGNEQPCYGLQAIGFDGINKPLDSNNKIARANILAMKKVQPTGPYSFIGYSHGGVVAFEMARLLLAQGEQIESLALIDCLCPIYQVNDVVEELVEICNKLMNSLGAKTNLDVEALRKVPENERCEYLYNIMSAQGFHLNREQFTTSFNVSTANDQCNRNYKPKKLSKDINVSLYRATNGYYQEMPDDFGWNEFLCSPVKIYDIEADHLTIIDKLPIQKIVKQIRVLSEDNKELDTSK